MARHVTESRDIYGMREQIKANLIALGIDGSATDSKSNIVISTHKRFNAFEAWVFATTDDGGNAPIMKAAACTTVAGVLGRLLDATADMVATRYENQYVNFGQQLQTMVGDGVFVLDDVLENINSVVQERANGTNGATTAAVEANGAEHGTENKDVEMIVDDVQGDGADDGVPHVTASAKADDEDEDDGTRTPAKTPRGLFSDDEE